MQLHGVVAEVHLVGRAGDDEDGVEVGRRKARALERLAQRHFAHVRVVGRVEVAVVLRRRDRLAGPVVEVPEETPLDDPGLLDDALGRPPGDGLGHALRADPALGYERAHAYESDVVGHGPNNRLAAANL